MKSNFWSSLSPWKRKVALWVSGILIFYAVFGFLILPPIVRVVAVKQLSKQLGREVSIEKVKINPFAFSASVRGFLIKDKDGQPFVSWDEVYVNLQFSSFFGHGWVIKDISVSKPFARVRVNKDSTFNFSDIIAKFATNAPAPPPKPVVAATNTEGGIVFLLRSVTNAVAMLVNSTNQFSVTIQNITVTNCALHLEDFVNSRPARLDLSELTLDAKNISTIPGTNLTANLSLRWNKNGSIKVATAVSLLPPTADIRLDLDQLDLGSLDPFLEPKLNLYILGSKIGLHGDIGLRTPKDGLPQVTFHGDASLDDFHTVDGVAAEDLVKWNSIGFNGIDVNLNPQSAGIQEIDMNNAYARLVIETNKTINLFNALRMTGTNAPDTNETEIAAAPKSVTTNAPLPQVSIGAIVITNTAFSFTDRSLSPNVNLAVQSVNGSIAGLSTEQLQHADIALSAMIDGVGPASITGTLNPFSGTLTNVIKISVKDMDLTPTGPYSGKFAGYGIAEGKLNLDLEYEIVGKKLTSKNVITLDQFTFGEKVDSPDATHLPVRLAIAILKDREGKIVLDVPVEGDLGDPKFRVGKVVARAIMNILEKVATSPFSLLGAVFGGGGEELSYQDFAPGSAELSPESMKKLDSIAKGLYERPGLKLEISGSVDPASDRDGLQRIALEKQLRTRQWLSLGKSERDATTPDQVVLTPDERASLVKKLFSEAEAGGKITPALIAANTNLAAAVAQLVARAAHTKKGAELLMKAAQTSRAQSLRCRRFRAVQTPAARRSDGSACVRHVSHFRRRPRNAGVRPRQGGARLHSAIR